MLIPPQPRLHTFCSHWSLSSQADITMMHNGTGSSATLSPRSEVRLQHSPSMKTEPLQSHRWRPASDTPLGRHACLQAATMLLLQARKGSCGKIRGLKQGPAVTSAITLHTAPHMPPSLASPQICTPADQQERPHHNRWQLSPWLCLACCRGATRTCLGGQGMLQDTGAASPSSADWAAGCRSRWLKDHDSVLCKFLEWRPS
ncbi:hypothetical protein DPEC_G00067570 [Dallia pectoralis]|uniref:Uncharacterized protein n=1 Tax=Dallia pectoralis TaxID=75939 RepID=A0ACC2H930_DALPE|nr:hypothetical protein DPEC_G00067570 [Dallia pectoralis]